MSDNPRANRYLEDKALDHIDHALGRPAWPLRESYRNYFATGVGGEQALEFAASPHWELRNIAGTMSYYSVTDAGRRALAEHLSAQKLDRVYAVAFEGHTRNVPAPSAAKARYSYYLSISDVIPDLSFRAFQRKARVQRAA